MRLNSFAVHHHGKGETVERGDEDYGTAELVTLDRVVPEVLHLYVYNDYSYGNLIEGEFWIPFESNFIKLKFSQVQWYANKPVSVFTYSDFSVLGVFLLIYAITTIMFCFMLSVFFSKANTAAGKIF